MNTTNNTIKLDRNLKIYEDYISGNFSYNDLAKKYDITSQRVQSIVSTMRDKAVTKGLKSNTPMDEREKYKNAAVELREAGNYKTSLKMFEDVIAWDEANKNYRGMADVLGHLKIVYNKLAVKTANKKESVQYYEKAEECLNKAIDLDKKGLIPEKSIKITYAHMASLIIYKALLLDEKEKKSECERAIKIVDDILKDFPGTEAHKAWALSIKGRGLFALGKNLEAFETFQKAEWYIFKYYHDEIKGESQSVIKVKVWHAMIYIWLARIALAEKKTILADNYARAVISFSDENSVIKELKKEARALLTQI